jgi:outer membrane lipoprotein carrier protein
MLNNPVGWALRAHRKASAALAVLIISLASVGQAQAAAMDQFKSFVASTKAAKGEFTQRLIKKAASAKVPAVSSGTFVFARPGKFIWTYSKPYVQVLHADGDLLHIYDKDLNQVTEKKLGDALGSSPAAILFGSNDLDKNFTLAEGGTRDGLEWLNATPKAKDTSFELISIGLRNGVPEAMELRDTFGQTSVLAFKNFEKNPVLPAQQFKFVVPQGADVFKN